MTHKQKILDYLWSIAPESATNSQIAAGTGIQSPQQVYLLTQELSNAGLIHSKQRSRHWYFLADESLQVQLAPVRPEQNATVRAAGHPPDPRRFEGLARRVMREHYEVRLMPGQVPGVPKQFDLVSPDRRIVGDAKYLTLVRGHALPPAKFSMIAEHVWLLEQTAAHEQFLVFGNDPDVPRLWLARYGHLVKQVGFFFLTDQGQLSRLNVAADPHTMD